MGHWAVEFAKTNFLQKILQSDLNRTKDRKKDLFWKERKSGSDVTVAVPKKPPRVGKTLSEAGICKGL